MRILLKHKVFNISMQPSSSVRNFHHRCLIIRNSCETIQKLFKDLTNVFDFFPTYVDSTVKIDRFLKKKKMVVLNLHFPGIVPYIMYF